ncbi:hypothetical protein NS228_25225 [Methylobacterium indicum]|uniref:Uncharacterized protein n=1 Tax=Methylobacterium indicum TaxID=1775910 RepID=A0A8H8WWX3_9HYPH|nr:hypothetical protein [Methylobacterium indicum]KTS20853.1 hypothetical protein NS229_23620 [Methylobacterium indicum]KTS27223.1 hypothetical protein NS228_25225 [Methylobacterium indicum]KTS42833.1 hypothetical protein NS230_27800 [Methylobacterium indicum]BCM85890.1 hypothetical protein mvi_43510 [Methylobacterium indicum]
MTRGTSRLVLLAVLAASPVVAQVVDKPLVDSPQRSREMAPNMPSVHETPAERVRPGDADTTGTVRPPAPDPKTTDGVLRPQRG